MNWLAIITTVIGILATVFVFKWQTTKKLLKEVSEVLVALSAAIEDDKVSKEEADQIIKECKHVVAAARDLVGK